MTLALMVASRSLAAWNGSLVPLMKTRPMRLSDGVGQTPVRAVGCSFIDAVAGQAGLQVGGAEHAARTVVAFGGDGVQVVDQLALVPHVIAGGHHVGAEFEEFIGDLRRHAEAARGILDIHDGEIDVVGLAQWPMCSRTMLRPALPKMSPTKRMFNRAPVNSGAVDSEQQIDEAAGPMV